MDKSEFGIIGLGVMGRNLALNLADKGIVISVYNREVPGQEEKIADKFIADNPGISISGYNDLKAFVSSLNKPRMILMIISSGEAVDSIIGQLNSFLGPEDILIDAGNSHFDDTLRRHELLKAQGIKYLGVGISGGTRGAKEGCSVMCGGPRVAYDQVKRVFELIAANDLKGEPCSLYCGPDSAGHFVKMVHNGIEYAEMQLLAEIYFLLRHHMDFEIQDITDLLESWQRQGSNSYLLNITMDILRKKEGDKFVIDTVLDVAGQKGTGIWSSITSLNLGIPSDTITAAVMARFISGNKAERIRAQQAYPLQDTKINKNILTADILHRAYQAARIINHAIGFDMLGKASQLYAWPLNLSDVARIWTGGCIIKSDLMEQIVEVFNRSGDHKLLLDPEIVELMKSRHDDLSRVIAEALMSACAVPVMSAAANYFYAYSSGKSPANLVQLQRDYIGAHGYNRIDALPDELFHTDWSEPDV